MLQRLNKQLEKIMPLITPISVILGVILSVYLKDFSYLIPWLFSFMTFSGSLSSNFKSLTEVITHPFPVFLAMCILHVFMPLWAWGVGHVAFYGDDFTITGLILAMVIPTGVTSFIWVSIYKGNIPLTLSIILVDTLLSPLIVPYSISLFMGQKIDMDFISIMKGLFGMVVIPSLIGMFFNQLTKGRIKEQLGSKLAPFSKICMGVVVMLNGSVVAPYLRHAHLKLVLITLVVFFIALTGYLFSFFLGRLIKSDRDTVITLTFTGGMRNISAGAVIAVSYFPAAVAVPVVVGMLFQQILASLNGHFLNKYYDRKIGHRESKSVAV
ncbi:bile acid:sodium symporter family protein [Bacillus salipaludis]|uniref:Bile acid:sodium symporter family protein n=1 Tax=Bacillus salipaludis TaxID=2547811 RepID=A0A4R5VQ54_9BACI|nr:bile acid:sodium symporter family protein [Bacillus salipaludis]MDQ6595904.1 bile acid:sodium symporter family protein [Bacillus salipaludis]TDK59764.1 bile acid:sodium symporter family protein [Bacillus salipaludis]